MLACCFMHYCAQLGQQCDASTQRADLHTNTFWATGVCLGAIMSRRGVLQQLHGKHNLSVSALKAPLDILHAVWLPWGVSVHLSIQELGLKSTAGDVSDIMFLSQLPPLFLGRRKTNSSRGGDRGDGKARRSSSSRPWTELCWWRRIRY